MKIGIIVLCTNGYFPLGIRFAKRFMQFYKGTAEIVFYLFTDCDPKPYLPEGFNFVWKELRNTNWVDGTNSKFTSILSLKDTDCTHLYFFDADTNVSKDFTEEWFIGDLVGGQHYADQTYMKEEKAYDRNPQSMAYIPKDTTLPQTYYYGAFFGASMSKMIELCEMLIKWQNADRQIGYEPVWNDESYLQKYFHYSPPKTILCKDFVFEVSDKGGIGETRNMQLNIEQLKSDLLQLKEKNVNIVNGKVIEI